MFLQFFIAIVLVSGGHNLYISLMRYSAFLGWLQMYCYVRIASCIRKHTEKEAQCGNL